MLWRVAVGRWGLGRWYGPAARCAQQPACRELELLELLSEHLRGRVRVAVSVRARARLGLGPGPGPGLGLEALRSSRHRSEHLLGVARHVLGRPVPVVAVLAVRALLHDPSLISLTDLGHDSPIGRASLLGTWTGHAFGGRTFGASRPLGEALRNTLISFSWCSFFASLAPPRFLSASQFVSPSLEGRRDARALPAPRPTRLAGAFRVGPRPLRPQVLEVLALRLDPAVGVRPPPGVERLERVGRLGAARRAHKLAQRGARLLVPG